MNHEQASDAPVLDTFRLTMTLATGEEVIREVSEFDFEVKWMIREAVGYDKLVLIYPGAYGYKERFECVEVKKENLSRAGK
ncbi:hypothetical protein ABEV74_19310 [Paenibacillus cisolokensis]|uniref:hypothetical protein n=1 Tax=Paenibacillus cisolokensis TaxID=1658519 RepID=UPI003D27AED5